MHNNCGGICEYAAGGVLWSLVYDRSHEVAGRNIATRLAQIWHEIKDTYQELHTEYRIPKLTLNMFTDADRPYQDFPCLRSSSAKCAQVRNLIPVLAKVVQGYIRGLERHLQEM